MREFVQQFSSGEARPRPLQLLSWLSLQLVLLFYQLNDKIKSSNGQIEYYHAQALYKTKNSHLHPEKQDITKPLRKDQRLERAYQTFKNSKYTKKKQVVLQLSQVDSITKILDSPKYKNKCCSHKLETLSSVSQRIQFVSGLSFLMILKLVSFSLCFSNFISSIF